MNPFKAAVLINIAAIASFTFLAWHFGRWWIALFAAVFAVSARNYDDEQRRRK